MTEFDDTLTRLFAETRGTPPADDFLAGVTSRMERERRRRSIKLAAWATAAGAVAVALTPYVAEGSLAVASRLGAWLPSAGNALASPVAWLCALTVAAWGLRRAKGAS
jgi:hypothetical protein